MILDYNLLKNLWLELAKGIVYLINHTVTTAIKDLTPLEALEHYLSGDKGKCPSITHIPALRCKAFVHLQKGHRVQSQKLTDRTKTGILVGFKGNHIYRVYVPSCPGDKIIWTSTVDFDEDGFITQSPAGTDKDSNSSELYEPERADSTISNTGEAQ